ncbi:hypothetical protein CYMTET_54879 [Cymbomonas tetramitiformis]|uniref:protein O-GlcNAc transferase n=1 Tax=Cymbomonas tetramitiformis TaxID=36881 RepID=A0AAE0BFF1_9CHLO|nr:hypothetical protein CYMTET_54879 [Cymbomonas tetramitiformis]
MVKGTKIAMLYLLPLAYSASFPGEKAKKPLPAVCPEQSGRAENLLQAAGKLAASGLTPEAVACGELAADAAPRSAQVAFQYARLLEEANRPEEALQQLHRAIQLKEDDAASWAALGSLLGKHARTDEAVEQAAQALQMAARIETKKGDNQQALLHTNELGLLYQRHERFEDALVVFQDAVKAAPNVGPLLNNVGNTLRRMRRMAEAAKAYRRAVKADPKQALYKYNLGITLQSMGEETKALKELYRAVKLKPELAEAHVRIAKMELKREPAASLRASTAALALQPRDSQHHYMLGEAHAELQAFEDALTAYRRSLTLSTSIFDRAEAFFCALHMEQFLCDWSHSARRAAQLPGLLAEELASLKEGHTPSIRPLQAILYIPGGALAEVTRKYAEYVQHATRDAAESLERAAGPRMPPVGGRLTIGYVSADFGNHPVGQLLQSIPGLHARSSFHVIVYALLPSDASPERLKVERECDVLRDVSALSDTDVARMIRADGVHILVDLMGYTRRSRAEIFGQRPAPIQVAYMGWPASTFAPYIDYIVADRVVAAPHLLPAYFSEKVIYMPHSYYANDYLQSSADIIHSTQTRNSIRAAAGLPAVGKGVVLCSFNQHFKLDAEIFDVWLNILHRAPSSVLWLLDWGGASCAALPAACCGFSTGGVRPAPCPQQRLVALQTAVRLRASPAACCGFSAGACCSFRLGVRPARPQQRAVASRLGGCVLRRAPSSVLWLLDWGGHAVPHLKAELQAAGIAEERLVIGPVLKDRKQHLQRAGAADLFLDTISYNGHTSAVDVLWASVPFVTVPVEKMPTRVAASLAHALPCEELVVHSLRQYEDLVVSLATNYVWLRGLQSLVSDRKKDSPLFDTARWVRDLEQRLIHLWSLYSAGSPKSHVL